MIFPIKDICWKEIALFTNDLSAIYKKLITRAGLKLNIADSHKRKQSIQISIAVLSFFGLRCLANSINERYEVDNGLRTLPTDLSVCIFFYCHPRIALLNTAKFSIYNPRHIKLGHPVLYPYSDKKLCPFPSRVEFFLLTLQLAKTNIEPAENTTTVPTKVTSIVATVSEYTRLY